MQNRKPAIRKPVLVLLLLDNRVLSGAIAGLLRTHRDLEVLVLANSAAALGHFDATRPTVMLVGGREAERDPRALVASLKRAHPGASMIIVDPPAEHLVHLVRAGASGFVARGATNREILSTVRRAARGARVLPAALTGTLFDYIARYAGEPLFPDVDQGRMTPRQREVFELVGEGLSNKAIARRLAIATNTVKGHVHDLLDKTELHTRVELALRARVRSAYRTAPRS